MRLIRTKAIIIALSVCILLIGCGLSEDGALPPESEPAGALPAEDFAITVGSCYSARPVITDKDFVVGVYIENQYPKDGLSSVEYAKLEYAELESGEDGQWISIKHFDIETRVYSDWTTLYKVLSLDEPLAAGEYRLRLNMRVLNPSDEIEVENEFSVIAYGDAPEPKWDTSQMSIYEWDLRESQGEDIDLFITNPVLTKENMELEYTIMAEREYSYGEYYDVEFLNDGRWKIVDFSSAYNFLDAQIEDKSLSVSPGDKNTHTCNPVSDIGAVPPGQYRLIKKFHPGYPSDMNWVTGIAEFIVEEPLDWAALAAVR
jgi:hypothetical protein